MDRPRLRRSLPRAMLALLAVLAVAVAASGTAWAEDGLTPPGSQTGVTQDSSGTYRPHVIVRQWGAGSPGRVTSVSVPVPIPCFYVPLTGDFASGAGLWNWFDSGQAAATAEQMGDPGAATPPPGLEAHKNDGPDKGGWWGGECDSANWADQNDMQGWMAYAEAWFAQHPMVFVPAGQAPPLPPIPPAVLMHAAYDAMRLPAPMLSHNPEQRGVVNLATWVWAQPDSFTEQIVEARYGDVWARVDAMPVQLHLSSAVPATVDSTCHGGGTPYDLGRPLAEQRTDCSVTFRKSTVGLPGGATVRATTTWQVSWTSSDPAQGGPLAAPANPAVGAFQVPVEEIQTVDTTGH